MRRELVVSLSCLATLSSSAAASQKDSTGQIRGLNPALAAKYQPDESGWWQCLDGKRSLPFSAVNDDFCDCEDGSDEPGTSACENNTFYCRNEGHIPDLLFASRVNDGICDPECCDGSDEWDSGVSCPNTCEETGRIYKETVAVAAKIRKTGSKIRQSYISSAKTERARLVSQHEKQMKDIEVKQAELDAATTILEDYESKDKDWVEKKKQSPLWISLMEHRRILNLLYIQGDNSLRDLEVLKQIMFEMRENYNPNYQDMAVKHAIALYEERHRIVESKPFTEMKSGIDEHIVFEENSAHKEALPMIADAEVLAILDMDPTDLLFKHVDEDEEAESSLFHIEQYIPEPLYPHYEKLRDSILMGLIKIGVISSDAEDKTNPGGGHTHKARAAYLKAQGEEFAAQEAARATQMEIDRHDQRYGPEAEWKKLEDVCVEKEYSGYVYSLCFLRDATQKQGHTVTNLGHFEDWSRDPRAEDGTERYYSTQHYTKGARCWNGPERSVTVDLSCGKDNALLSVAEPQKCEYQFKVTTPALCWPDPAWSKHRANRVSDAHEEL